MHCGLQGVGKLKFVSSQGAGNRCCAFGAIGTAAAGIDMNIHNQITSRKDQPTYHRVLATSLLSAKWLLWLLLLERKGTHRRGVMLSLIIHVGLKLLG
jgi:hypothetical protein